MLPREPAYVLFQTIISYVIRVRLPPPERSCYAVIFFVDTGEVFLDRVVHIKTQMIGLLEDVTFIRRNILNSLFR